MSDNPVDGRVYGATGCTVFLAEGSGDRRELVPEVVFLSISKPFIIANYFSKV